MYIIIRNIIRNKKQSLITMLICVLFVELVTIYLGNMQSNRNQLNHLSETIPVQCQITNLNGTKSTGIWIDETLSGKLIASGQIKDAAYGIQMLAGIGDFPAEDWGHNATLSVEGINCMEAVPGLAPESVSLDVTKEDFWGTADSGCIVRDALMEQNRWEIGEEIPVNLYYYEYDDEKGICCCPLETLKITIVGKMNHASSSVDAVLPDILLPIGLLKECFARNQIPLNPSFFSFSVANPLMINDFKSEMKSLGLMEVNAMADDSYEGCALTVRDTAYIAMAEKLQRIIQIFERFRGLVFLTIAGVAYIVSTLLTESRKQEFALMRALGGSAVKCMRYLLAEQLCLVFMSLLIGDSICLLLWNAGTVFSSDAMLVASYLAGCTAALFRFGKTSPMQLLLGIG